jgi:large subunit ribosomal protein L15e
MYKHLSKTLKSPEYKADLKKKLISWRKEPVSLKIDKPSNLTRARLLGYKAKQGFVMVRTKIGKGTRKRETPSGGRKPLRMGRTKYTPGQSLQHIAEMRVARKHPNMQVLNSYYIAEDGQRKWFEIILVDPNHPVIKKDPKLKWLAAPSNKGRVFRGLTSAGKKSRMLGKGKGSERKNTNKRF